MRVALIYYRNNSFTEMKELLLRVPYVEVNSFLLLDNVLFTENGQKISLHGIAIESDVYVLDPRIPQELKENIHHYLNTFSVEHLYGQTHILHNVSHDFLVSKVLEIQNKTEDIEHMLAQLWTKILHPVRIRRKDSVSPDISSIHELRRETLSHVLQGEHMECIYQPKGRKLTCTLVRNARGKKIYATPLFEKITHTFGDKLSSATLSLAEKEKIIKKLESLFAHYPSFPTLHVELTHTPKGIYLMHAAPIQNLSKEHIPETLNAIGMQPYEILASCFASLPTK